MLHDPAPPQVAVQQLQQQQQQQRKRKILRKTRNTSPHSARLAAAGYAQHHSHHHAHDAATSSDGLMASACSSNFGLWIAVVMTCGWLFILSYMTAVVYSENRRLEAQLFKLAASSQKVPDELQHWHESAKWLEQNQTALQQRLLEADQRAAGLEQTVQALRTEFKVKYDDSSDHEKVRRQFFVICAIILILQCIRFANMACVQVSRLQQNVANFGAQLKDLTLDVATVKERTVALRTDADSGALALRTLDAFVRASNATSLDLAAGRPVNNATVRWLVHNVTDELHAQLHGLQSELDRANYTLGQRIAGMEEDGRSHKTRLDALTENYANVTAHVVSIENSLREHAAAMTATTTTTTTTTAGPSVEGALKAQSVKSAAMATVAPAAVVAGAAAVTPTVVAATGNAAPAKTKAVTSADPSLQRILSERNAPGRS